VIRHQSLKPSGSPAIWGAYQTSSGACERSRLGDICRMKKIFITLVAGSLMAACNSGTSIATDKQPSTAETAVSKKGKNTIRFKVDGQQVETTGWTISRFTYGSDPKQEWLNITSNMKMDKRTINVNLKSSAPGTYTFQENASTFKDSHGAFYPDYLGDIANSYSFKGGSFTITAIDVQKGTVNATFQGIVKNLKGQTLAITEGEISEGLLNHDVIRY
jgi:hypothetical protein